MGTTKRRLRVVLDHFGTKSAPSASSIHSGGAGGGSSSSMSPHPGTPLLTKAFEWERDGAPPSCAAATLRVCTPAQAHQFSEQGYFLLEGAFGAAEIGAIRAHVDALEAELAHDGGISASGQISFCAHLVNRSATCRTFTAHHVLADLCSDLLGPDARLYWDQSVYKKPSSAGRIFPFHQDNGYTFIEPQPYLTCWIALNDATPENGCPHVVPGVHRGGARRHRMDERNGGWTVEGLDTSDAVCVPAKAGSIVVFSSLTPHMTGPNNTDKVRKAYICQYARDGARMCAGGDGSEIVGRPLANAPDRQYFVLRGGQRVMPPAIGTQLRTNNTLQYGG